MRHAWGPPADCVREHAIRDRQLGDGHPQIGQVEAPDDTRKEESALKNCILNCSNSWLMNINDDVIGGCSLLFHDHHEVWQSDSVWNILKHHSLGADGDVDKCFWEGEITMRCMRPSRRTPAIVPVQPCQLDALSIIESSSHLYMFVFFSLTMCPLLSMKCSLVLHSLQYFLATGPSMDHAHYSSCGEWHGTLGCA